MSRGAKLPDGYKVYEIQRGPKCVRCNEPAQHPDFYLEIPGGTDVPLIGSGNIHTRPAAEKFAVEVLKARGVIT